jgi:hypothetical protein
MSRDRHFAIIFFLNTSNQTQRISLTERISKESDRKVIEYYAIFCTEWKSA